MGRPAGYQWRPLGLDSDPVPGDPGQVSDEARHLASVAAEITGQVAALRQISGDGTEIGEHADKIRSSASDLADQLDKLVGRYQKVSSALSSWVPDLEQAQSMSLQALNQAEGPYQKLNQTVALPSGPNMTPQQKQDVQSYHNSMKQAQGELAAAHALLDRATSLRDTAGGHTASLIVVACDDGMKDHHSLWGDITGFFSHAWSWVAGHWSQILADVCTVLEGLATILAIVVFVVVQFLPGIDIAVDALVAASLFMTLGAAVGRGILAGTGHGSWLDFALDVFSLATFGAGRAVGALAEGAVLPAAEAASKTALTSELITDFATDGPRAAMVMKYASLEGVDAVDMANRLGDLAPTLAKDAELSGFAKVMMNLGGFGKEEQAYAKIIALSDRFTTPISDMSQYASVAKSLAGIAGISAATSGVAGIAATVLNGWELDAGDWQGTAYIPPLHNWFYTHLEVPMGAPAGG